MTASERQLLTLAINGQPRLRGLGIVDLSGNDCVVVQRPAVGVTTYLLVTSRNGGGPPATPPLTVMTGLHFLGVTPRAMTAAGTLGDRFSLFLTNGGSMIQDMARMNAQFLELQNAVQNEGRKFQTISNASKTRHDAAKKTIQNMKG